MNASSSGNKHRQRIRLPLWGLSLLIIAGLTIVLITAVWLFNTVQSFASSWDVVNPDFDPGTQPVVSTSGDNGSTASNSNNASEPEAAFEAPERWSGHDRVTILALGIDERCDEEGPTRTDTMMVLTMDPVGLSAAVLSLPRDLWVEIPGFGVDKINQAHFLGEVYDYPGGGPVLAVETVENLLGIDINYYITVDFKAFVDLVDEVDGIDIMVPEAIDDSTYPDNCYGYDPFFIRAGEQHLDGQTALKYARTRATLGGDVDRAQRQQEVVIALRDKVFDLNMVPRLLPRAPELWHIFQDNVQTNLSLSEIIQLALVVQDIPRSSIREEVIDYDYVYNEMTADGQAVLIPVRENIRALRDQLFAPPAVPTPVIEHLPEMMLEEQARVAIYNGTPTFGLAASTQEYLAGFNINIVEVGNADSAEYRSTQIIDFGAKPNTALYLAQLLEVPPLNISSGVEPPGDFDVLVILGSDWQVPDSSQISN